ncbi:MAG: hypothetical protein GX205_01080 [Firmicutes bacterium]|nr:hypothetical protein [Bacillota bacterium]
MSKVKRFFLLSALIAMALLTSGCLMGTETVKIEYLPDFKAQKLFHDYQPTIAVNRFWDERSSTDRVGEGYNIYGGKVETWKSDRPPTDVIEEALVHQLENAGFQVIRTSGWDLTAEGIPEYLSADAIMGGRLKMFWVESRPGLVTVSVNSNVVFDLFLADIKERRIIWAGQFRGEELKEALVRTHSHMADAINSSLSNAVNKVFQDESLRQQFIRLGEIKF